MKLDERSANEIAERCATFIIESLGRSLPKTPMDVVGSELAELIGDLEDRVDNRISTFIEENNTHVTLDDLWE